MLSTEFARVDLEGLRARLGYPDPPALQKIADHLDENCKIFLAHSPFATLATSDAEGNCDSSPRGDYPGFVRVIDDRTVVIPDRIGNKIADSMTNILENPHVGLLCFVPGMSETLRLNGRAYLTDDPDVLRMLEQDHSPPNLAIVVNIDQAYLHCGRALLRSGLWDPEMQDLAAEVPTSGTIWASMSGFDPEIAQVIDDAVAGDGYQNLY
jgi:PPOX class probable FMN-dependent enzyme